MQLNVTFAEKNSHTKLLKTKITKNLEAIAILQVNIEVQDIVSVVFHNGSNYDYHFIMKELVYEFKSQFEYLRGNTEKYQVFQFQFKKKSEKLVNMVMRLLELFLTK